MQNHSTCGCVLQVCLGRFMGMWLYVCGVNVLLTCVCIVRCVVDGQLVSVVVVSLKVYMLLSGVLQCGIEL